MRVRVTVLSLAGLLLASSCTKVPPPTQEELYARDQWAAVVTDEDRRQVFAEANTHTGWSDKRKVQYELMRFQKLWRNEDRQSRWEEASRKAGTRPSPHASGTQPTTARSTIARSTTRATTRATTRSSQRSTSRPTTRHHSTRGSTTNPAPEEDMEE